MTPLQQELERIGPAPGDDPVDRLRHAVKVYEDSDPDEWVVRATSNVYGDGVTTGITWNDLRIALALIDAQAGLSSDASLVISTKIAEDLYPTDRVKRALARLGALHAVERTPKVTFHGHASDNEPYERGYVAGRKAVGAVPQAEKAIEDGKAA